jgi:outer membrane protein assembly factor BamB
VAIRVIFAGMTGMLLLPPLLLLLGVARADDWPRWRGPHDDGVNRESGLLQTWPQTLQPLWVAEVGVGFSAPVARDRRVYLFSLVGGRDTLTCYDALTGAVIWSHAYDGGWEGYYPGTRASPFIEGDRIYTYGGCGDLVARELATGNLLWRINVVEQTKAIPLLYAQASNLLVIGDLIFVQGGMGRLLPESTPATTTAAAAARARVDPARATSRPATSPATTRFIGSDAPRTPVPIAVAVDKRSGNIVWQSETLAAGSYSRITPIEVQGRTQLLVFAYEGPTALDPATGKKLWHLPWRGSNYGNAADPIVRDGFVFITSNNLRGSMVFQVTSEGPRPVWESKDTTSRFPTPILDGDCLFVNSNGSLKCLKWPTSEVRWSTPRKDTNLLGFGGSIVRIEGERLILLSQSGRLSLAKATAQGFELISTIPDFVDGSQVWATPILHEGKLYVKGEKELVCVNVKAE